MSRILTIALTNSRPDKALANEATEAVAVDTDKDKAIKAVSLVRKIDRINRNAC